MGQVTWRADDALIRRAKDVAAEQGRSLNDYLTRVVDAATDPDLASTDARRIRERLARAGLLAEPAGETPASPPEPEVAAARARAAEGRPLSDYVREDRDA